ncbi:hypothetical protein HAX54_024304 [Datura stramonium]|uniref:Uncharacterized protein n=1 Tax=Datura stramonium TaxID=4076 RepID=A0ABS8UZW1_DATST|nr:hypothetical protein [Datura stramonium]
MWLAGAIVSHANKGKEVDTSRKDFKGLIKGVTPSSLAPRAPPARNFRAQAIEEHGLKWSMHKRRPNTTLRTRLMKAVEDPVMYFLLIEKPPYRDICHILCGEHSTTRWTQNESGVHSTLLFSYFTRESKVWEWYPLTKRAMLMYKVGPIFVEPLYDDEPTVLIDVVDNDDDEEDDATMGAMMVYDTTDTDDQYFNPNDDDYA